MTDTKLNRGMQEQLQHTASVKWLQDSDYCNNKKVVPSTHNRTIVLGSNAIDHDW